MKNKIDNFIIYAFILLLGAMCYILDSNITIRSDDILYQYMYLDVNAGGMTQSIDIDYPVKTPTDAAISQYNHYFSINGRAIVHFISQIYIGILGKQVFNITNVIMFVIFILLCVLFTSKKRIGKPYHWMIVLFCLWFLLPGNLLCGSLIVIQVSYMWSAILCICFLLLLNYTERQTEIRRYQIPFFLIFAFIAGWTNESLTIGISGGLVLYYFLNKNKINRIWVFLAVFFILGTCMIVFSPASMSRGIGYSSDFDNLFVFLIRRIIVVTNLRAFWILLLINIFLYFKDKTKLTCFIKRNQLLLFALISQLLFSLFIGYFNNRALWGIELFSVLLIVKLIYEFELDFYRRRYILYSFAVLTFVIFNTVTIYYSFKSKNEYNRIIAEYLEDEHGIAFYDQFEIPGLWNKYISRFNNYRGWAAYVTSFYYNKQLNLYPYSYKRYLNNDFDNISATLEKIPGNNNIYLDDVGNLLVMQTDRAGLDNLVSHGMRIKYLPASFKDNVPLNNRLHRLVFHNEYSLEENIRIECGTNINCIYSGESIFVFFKLPSGKFTGRFINDIYEINFIDNNSLTH